MPPPCHPPLALDRTSVLHYPHNRVRRSKPPWPWLLAQAGGSRRPPAFGMSPGKGAALPWQGARGVSPLNIQIPLSRTGTGEGDTGGEGRMRTSIGSVRPEGRNESLMSPTGSNVEQFALPPTPTPVEEHLRSRINQNRKIDSFVESHYQVLEAQKPPQQISRGAKNKKYIQVPVPTGIAMSSNQVGPVAGARAPL